MTNNPKLELEKRAAGTMGGEPLDGIDGSKNVAFIFREDFKFRRVQNIEQLSFTTSYDWAMLLVKEIVNINITARLLRFYEELDKIVGPAFAFCFATPEQITLAACEVLDGR